MNVPSPGPSDAHERSRLSPVDSPFTSARSQSGHLVPYSPTPERRYSRDYISWMTGSQTSLHAEPGSIDQAVAPQPNSSASIHTHHDNHTPTSDILFRPSPPPSPLHRIIGFAPETSPGISGVQTPPHPGHIHFDANQSDPHRSRTPLSMKSSSQRSISQKSGISRNSMGRASYREHRGSPARVRTPALNPSVFGPSPSSTLRIAEPGGSVTPGNLIAPPSADDPNQPGEPAEVGFRFSPFSVNDVSRYDNRAIRCPSESNYTIDAMMYHYPEMPEGVPEGWAAYRHPEGALYFVHDESKTFTEVNVCDEDIHMDIEYFRRFLFSELEAEIENRNISEYLQIDEVQLVLEPKVDKQGLMCCYYFVNPRARSVFWLDEWDGRGIIWDCKGNLSLRHKGLAIQADYWWASYVSHCDVYPNFCEVTQQLKDEVVAMILHATCDHLTSNTSACPLNPEELQKHLSLVDRIEPEKREKHAHCAIILSRIMRIFYRNHFLNFYGEDCARLNFDQTIHGWRYHPSLLMTTFSPLLFMAPVNNVRLLHRIFVDNIASKEKWNMFVNNLNSQMQETSVLATVLLNANVGFLPKQSGTGTSPQQFLSYLSLVASMASIILGLVFMGHSRTEARNTPFEAAKFLHELRHERYGLEKLAIVYSLPHAFLMWGMFLFFAAFAVQWCYPNDTILRASAAGFMFVVALLVAWCIWTARDRCGFWWFQPDPKQVELEDDEGDGKVPESGFLYRFTSLLTRNFTMTISPPEESHPMQDTTSRSQVTSI